MSKESLAQQGGYALTNKGPQHDEAWLIFMDMVNKHIPTFEDKAEALHYFPLFRTWFGLQRPLQAALERHRAGRQRRDSRAGQGPRARPELLRDLLRRHRPRDHEGEDHRAVGEGLQLPARLQPAAWARGRREHDWPPYRSVGPVTVEEYESRAERYDKQMLEEIGVDPAGQVGRGEDRHHPEVPRGPLPEAAATRSTSAAAGRPTASRRWRRSQELGIDFPEVVELVAEERGLTRWIRTRVPRRRPRPIGAPGSS